VHTSLRLLGQGAASTPDEKREWSSFTEATVSALLGYLSKLPIGVGICDGALRFVVVNSELASMHGFSERAHYGKPGRVHPRLPPGIVDGMRRALGTGEPILNLQIRSMPQKPAVTPAPECIASFYPLVRRETEDVVGAMLVEIAEPPLLKSVLDALPEGVLLLSPQGRIRVASTAAERILGSSPGQLNGRYYGDQRWQSRRHGSRCPGGSIVAKVVLTGEPVFEVEQYLLGADGARRLVVESAAPLRDPKGAVYEVVVSLRDVTLQTRQADALRTSLEFQEHVIGIVGHDLRNPLTAILGSAGLLDKLAAIEGPRSPLGVRTIARIVHSAKRMERLIRDLLDYTRVRAGRGLPIVLAPANLHDICRDAADEATSAYPERRVRLDLEGDGAGVWDADRIQQIVSNLIGNAVQHGRRGAPVDLSVHPLADERLSIEVRSQGDPIPESFLPHLFEPFRQGNRGRSERKGIGLGLYIVAQITAAHGGSVMARSSTDETVFQVVLPRQTVA
jgi:PAS domain S-box-containing protein